MSVLGQETVFLPTEIICELLNLLPFKAPLMPAPPCLLGSWGHTLCCKHDVHNEVSATVAQILAEALSVLF